MLDVLKFWSTIGHFQSIFRLITLGIARTKETQSESTDGVSSASDEFFKDNLQIFRLIYFRTSNIFAHVNLLNHKLSTLCISMILLLLLSAKIVFGKFIEEDFHVDDVRYVGFEGMFAFLSTHVILKRYLYSKSIVMSFNCSSSKCHYDLLIDFVSNSRPIREVIFA